MTAYIEELEEMDTSEIHDRRLNAKEVLTPLKGDFHVPSPRQNSQNPWRRSTSETIHLNPGSSRMRRGTRSFSRRIRRTLFSNLFKMTQHGMMRKPNMISGLLREISFMAITWNPESNCTCRKKSYFLFR